jgi:hypothetical protein
VVVPCGHEDHVLAARGPQHLDDVRRDQRPPGEDAQVHGLEVGEVRVVALDQQHGLVWCDLVAVVEGMDC